MAITNTYPVMYPEGTVTDDGAWIVANLNGLNGEYLKWCKNGGEDGATAAAAGAVTGISTAAGIPLVPAGGVITLPAIPVALNSFTSTSTTDAAAANTVRVLEQALLKTGTVNSAGILTLVDRSNTPLSPPIDLSSLKTAIPPTTVSNTVTGIGLTRQITTTVNGVTGAPVFIPDQNNRDITFGGTAAAPTISNDGITFVPLPLTPLDGNDKHIARTNAATNVPPTAIDVPLPIAGDTAKILLADKSIEYWSYGTTWVKDFTYSIAPDDIVDVTGATLPITFPIAAIPGTPVFAPATPTSTTAIYAITNGTAIVYAKWNGTQYISAPAPTATPGHFRSGAGLTGPDGVNDPIENIARIGKTGLGIADPGTVLFTYENGGTTGVRADVLASATATCTIPAAATNLKSLIVVTQTAVDAVLLFAAPNVAAMAGQVFTVTNSDLSTHKISYLGYDIHPNQSLDFLHTGRMWQIKEVGINSDIQLEAAIAILPTATTASGSFSVVAGGIQSSTTQWVEVPGTSFVATGSEYLTKYVVYSSCTGTTPNLPAVGNGFRIAVGSNIASGTVQVNVPATGRVVDTSQSLVTNLAANQIDSYTKTVIVKAKAGETIQLQMNSVVGAQIVYQSATQNSRLEYAKIVNTVSPALATGLLDTPIVASATAYVFLPTDSTLAYSGNFAGVGQVTTPAAATNTGRLITLRMPDSKTFLLNVISGGGNIEMPNYTLTGSARINSAAFGSITWQSDGIAWRLFNYDERKFYPTAGYSVPSFGAQSLTFLGIGGAAPAPGAVVQIPPGWTSYLVLDGNYTTNPIALPVGNNATGRFGIYVSNSAATFPTLLSTSSSNLPRDTSIPGGQGLSMHFEWADTYWRWVPSPEPLSSGARYQRRGTYANPLTGAITVLLDDERLYVGNGSVTTLPAPGGLNVDRRLIIKKPGGGSASIVGSVDGVANTTMTAVNESLTLHSDGNTWVRD